MDKVPDSLPAIEVLDEQGQPRKLAELWKDRPAVIHFVRHFGWMFCAQQVAEFRPHARKLKEQGVDTFVIGSGAPNFARGFAERMGGDIPIFSDQERASYQALEMHRGACTVLDPRSFVRGLTAVFKYRQRRTMGDQTQQGGTIVVRPDGSMPFKFLSRYAGEHARPEDVVRAALQ